MTKEQMLGRLAPPAPPCFETRDSWLSYCVSVTPMPLVRTRIPILEEPPEGATIEDGMEVTFDRGFKFCADCEFKFRDRMRGLGRCKPDSLKE